MNINSPTACGKISSIDDNTTKMRKQINLLIDKILKFQHCPTFEIAEICEETGGIDFHSYGECQQCWYKWLNKEIEL